MADSQRHRSLMFDFSIVALGAALAFVAIKFGFEAGHPRLGAGLGGLYILYLGVLFLLSYFFPRGCFAFFFLAHVCEACSRPSHRAMAWFYFVLSLALGSLLLLVGLGVL